MNDVEAIFYILGGRGPAAQDTGRARDACERIAYLVGQAGGKLPCRGEPFSLFHFGYVLVKLPVDLLKLLLGLF